MCESSGAAAMRRTPSFMSCTADLHSNMIQLETVLKLDSLTWSLFQPPSTARLSRDRMVTGLRPRACSWKDFHTVAVSLSPSYLLPVADHESNRVYASSSCDAPNWCFRAAAISNHSGREQSALMKVRASSICGRSIPATGNWKKVRKSSMLPDDGPREGLPPDTMPGNESTLAEMSASANALPPKCMTSTGCSKSGSWSANTVGRNIGWHTMADSRVTLGSPKSCPTVKAASGYRSTGMLSASTMTRIRGDAGVDDTVW